MVASLRDEAINLGISACVDFVVNAPYSQLHSWLSRAAVGLHTMWNEHFGMTFLYYFRIKILVQHTTMSR